jgi:hypothetical protein
MLSGCNETLSSTTAKYTPKWFYSYKEGRHTYTQRYSHYPHAYVQKIKTREEIEKSNFHFYLYFYGYN